MTNDVKPSKGLLVYWAEIGNSGALKRAGEVAGAVDADL